MKDQTDFSVRRVGLLGTSLAIAVSIGIYTGALAGDASDIRAGQELAAKVCSPCHVISERPGPSFAEIANGGHADPEALLAFLRSTHSDVSHPGAMPNLELTDRQIEQISAYLRNLRAAK